MRAFRQGPPPSVLLLPLLIGLGMAGCEEDDGPSASEPLAEPIRIQQLVLEDSHGQLVAASASQVEGRIPCLVDESIDISIRAVHADGVVDPRVLGSGIDVSVIVGPDDIIEAELTDPSLPTSLRLLGLATGASWIRLVVESPDSVIFASPEIPVEVLTPAGPIHGLKLTPPAGDPIFRESQYEGSGYWSSGPIFFEEGDLLTIQVTFIGEDRQYLSPEEIGEGAVVSLLPSAPGILGVEPLLDDPFTFRLSAIAPGSIRLGFRLQRNGQPLYESEGAEVQVEERILQVGPIRGLKLTRLSPPGGDPIFREWQYEGGGYTSSGPIFFGEGDRLTIQVIFIGEDGQDFTPEEIGEGAVVSLLPSAPGILEVTPQEDDPYVFRLNAIGVGSIGLGFRLQRYGETLYESDGAEVHVVARTPGWATAGDPDGPVVDIVTWQEKLLVAGDFTQIGGVEANGAALFDGRTWSPFLGLPGLTRLYVEGDDLAALRAGDGFYRWTGADWAYIAPVHESMRGSALFHGEVVVTGGNLGVLAWRNGAWTQIGVNQHDEGTTLCLDGGRLLHGGSYAIGLMFSRCFVRSYDGTAWEEIFGDGCGDNCSCSIGHLRAHGDRTIVLYRIWYPGFDGNYLFQLMGDLTVEIGQACENAQYGAWVTESARFGDRFFFLTGDDRLLVQEDLGLREVARADVADIESFQGQIYVGGGFTEIGGVAARYLASWTP